jgi:heme oxygenase (biliverdin-IX-beta and delta-forming)
VPRHKGKIVLCERSSGNHAAWPLSCVSIIFGKDAGLNSGEELRRLLKAHTSTAHGLLEARLNLIDEDSDRHRYAAVLEGFYRFFLPFERFLSSRAQTGAPAALFYLRDRCKTDWLRFDLVQLGLQPSEPRPIDFKRFESAGRLWGALYVIEGSSLGARVITKFLQSHLGLDASSGGRFHEGYGAATAANWRLFLDRLQSAVDSGEADLDEVLEGALQMFHLLLLHFDNVSTGAPVEPES